MLCPIYKNKPIVYLFLAEVNVFSQKFFGLETQVPRKKKISSCYVTIIFPLFAFNSCIPGVCHQVPYSSIESAVDCFNPYEYGEDDEVEQVNRK